MKRMMILTFTVILTLPFMTGVTPARAQPSSGNSWATKAPMPTARVHLMAASVDGKIYAIGGCCVPGGTRLNAVEEYDPATDTWTTKTPMPTRRLGSAVGVVNGIIYVIGGEPNGPPVNTNEAYDPITDTWTPKASMPTARSLPSASVVNGKIYVIGGNIGSAVYTNLVEKYDPATDTWTNCGTPAPGNACAPMSTVRFAPTSHAINGKIYVVGGFDGVSGVDSVEEYDPATNTFTNCGVPAPGNGCAPMERGDRGTLITSSAVNGKIYVFGGYINPGTGFVLTDRVDEYDPATNAWTNCGGTPSVSACATLPTPRDAATSSQVNGKIYVIGGTDASAQLGTVEEYTPPSEIAFATFDITKAEIEFKEPNADEFEVRGEFILGISSDGIDPVNENVAVTVGSASVTIPAGSFGEDDGKFEFEGVINDADVRMEIEALDTNTFRFEAEAIGVDLTGTPNPVDIGLTIDDDTGTATVSLEGELKFEE